MFLPRQQATAGNGRGTEERGPWAPRLPGVGVGVGVQPAVPGVSSPDALGKTLRPTLPIMRGSQNGGLALNLGAQASATPEHPQIQERSPLPLAPAAFPRATLPPAQCPALRCHGSWLQGPKPRHLQPTLAAECRDWQMLPDFFCPGPPIFLFPPECLGMKGGKKMLFSPPIQTTYYLTPFSLQPPRYVCFPVVFRDRVLPVLSDCRLLR